MAAPREWREADILRLIRDGEKESLTLEYKSCDALVKHDDKKTAEVSKDVSAFANATGGVVVYSATEDKKDKHVPLGIDAGFDPSDITKEWLEQVINSKIHPRLDELYINPVELTTTNPGKVVYVVEIPHALTRPPHQAHDRRYYRRYNFEVLAMEDYEIRDMMNRSKVPDLDVEVNREPCPDDGKGNVRLRITIWNRGLVLAKYVSCVCDVIDPAYQISPNTYTDQRDKWLLGGQLSRSVQFIPNVNNVVYPELAFEAGFVEFAPRGVAPIPPTMAIELSLFADGMSRKRISISNVVTGVPPVFHYP